MAKNIILASASPRRREILGNAGVDFTVLTGDWEEHITKTIPSEVVEELSREKAFHGAEELPKEEGLVVIGADTIVAFEGQILGKPADSRAAFDMLRRLQGNTHQVYTGVTLAFCREGKWNSHTFHECTEVEFYPVSDEEIEEYIKTGEPMDKAGSYGIQGLWGIYVKGIRGDYNNVVGLPVARLFYEGKKLGINLKG